MKSKKLAIILSVVLTLGLAVGALFIGAQLNKETYISPENSKAAEPTVTMAFGPTVTLIPTGNPETITERKACGVSNVCVSNNECEVGNTCFSVNGTKRCVASMCLTNGATNDVCDPDLCTAKQKIDIAKTVSVGCVQGENKKRLSYTIVLTNPIGVTNSRTGLTVMDTLDPKMKSEYVIRTSIPFGGDFVSGKITWTGLSLTPNGGRLEIKYDAIIPPSEYGKEYVNNVIVSEGGIVRGSQTITNKIEVLPCTAIISDQADMIIMGSILVVFGIIMYRLGMDKKVGNFFWNKLGGRNIVFNLEGGYQGVLFKKDKEDFENKQRQRRSR